MDQTRDRLSQLEKEVQSLQKQLEQTRDVFFRSESLNNLYVCNKEVLMYVENNEQMTVRTVSDSISAFGYTPDDFTSGKIGWRDMLYQDDVKEAFKYFHDEISRKARNVEHEHRIITKDGKPVWVACIALLEYNADGELTNFLCKFKDISKRKKKEQEVLDVNENLSVTLKSVGEAVIQTDINGHIVLMNAAAQKLAGIINSKACNKYLSAVMQFSHDVDFSETVDPLIMKPSTGKMVVFDEIFMKCGDVDKVLRVSCNVSPILVGRSKRNSLGYVLAIKDLTAIYDALQTARESEAKLQESESTIRGIFDYSTDGMSLINKDGTVLEYGAGNDRICGITKEMAVGKKIWEVVEMILTPQDDTVEGRARVRSELEQTLVNIKQQEVVCPLMNLKTGEQRIFSIIYFPVITPEGVMLGCINRDVTESVRAQEKIRQSEEKLAIEKKRLELLGDNMPNGCLFQMVFDTVTGQLKYTYLSKSWEDITNIPADVVIADFNIQLKHLHPEDLLALNQQIAHIAKYELLDNFYAEIRFVFDNGEMRWLKMSTTPHLDDTNVIWDGFYVDVTEYKLAEQKILSEIERVETLGNNIPGGTLFRFITKYLDGKMIMVFEYVSATWEKITGVPADVVLNDVNSVFAKIHPEDLPNVMDMVNRCCDEMFDINIEARYLHPDGTTRWLHLASHPHKEGTDVVSDGFILDVTDRKIIEQNLIAEKERLKALGDNFPNGVMFRFWLDMSTQAMGLDYLSSKWEDFTGIPAKDIFDDFNNFLNCINPDDLPHFMSEIERCVQTLENFYVEVRFSSSNRKNSWINISSHPHREGDTIYSDGFILDITDRKIAEHELKAERDRIQTIGDHFPNGVLFRAEAYPGDIDSIRYTYISKSWEKCIGTSREEALKDFSYILKPIHPEDLPRLMEAVASALMTQSYLEIDYRFYYSEGEIRWTRLTTYPRLENGKVIGDGIILDITEQKNAEIQLIAEKERIQAIGDHFPNGVLFRAEAIQGDINSIRITYMSDSHEKILSIPKKKSPNDFFGILQNVHPDDLPKLVNDVTSGVNFLSPINVEYRIFYSESEMHWLSLSAHSRIENNKVVSDGFIINITDQKLAEIQLIAEKERLQALGDNFPSGSLFRFKADLSTGAKGIDYVSGTWEKFSGVPAKDILNNYEILFDRVSSSEKVRIKSEIEKSIQELENFNFETLFYSPNGEKRWFQISAHPHREGDIVYSDGFILDITDRKKIEMELEIYRNDLERLVKERTEELEATNEELEATNEELYASNEDLYTINEEFAVTNEELHDKNNQLNKEMAARKIIMQKLEDSESKMRNFIQQSFEGIIILDDQGRVIEWNEAQGRIMGISREDALGRYEWDLLKKYHPKDELDSEFVERHRKSRLEYIKNGRNQKPISTESTLYMPDGTERHIHVSVFPIELVETCYLGLIMHDNTEQHLTDIELEQYRNQLEEMVEIKTYELVASQDRLVSLSNNLPGGIIFQLMDNGLENAKFTYISALFPDLFEVSVDEAMNDVMTFYDCIMPKDRHFLLKQYNHVDVKRGSDIDFEFRINTKSRKAKWVHMRASYQINEDGMRVWDGFMIDITSRKLAEKELDNVRRRQAILIKVLQILQSTENISDALNASLEEIGSHADVSRAYIFENNVDGLTVSNTYEWCNEGITSEIDNLQYIAIERLKDWYKTFDGGKYICTSNIGSLDQSSFETLEAQGILSILAIPLVAGGINYGFIGFDECRTYRTWENAEIDLFTSISQIISTTIRRKRAEEAMRQSEEMYRQLTVASPDAIIVCGSEGRIRYVSPKALELFGFEADAEINMVRMVQFVHSHDRRQAFRLFDNMAKENISFIPQILLTRKDGSEFFGEISAAPVKGSEDQNTSIIMVIRDVTQRKADEMELVRAKEKAEESDRLKSAFLANMSHEIRTPLNGIVGFLNFLSSENLSSRRRQEYINVINNSSIQLVKLIDDIIDVAKIEARQMKLRPIPFRINNLMTEMQVFFETYLQINNKERVALILDNSGFIDNCLSYVDPMRLQQILNNLISNAVKFTEKGFIRFGYKLSASNMLEFVVEDSGIGLERSQLEVIFERFRQVELSNNRQYGGTGLGLTISRNMAQLMGGDMWVESVEGVGSSFYFTISYLPVCNEDEQLFDNLSAGDHLSNLQFNDKVVLVVEPEIMKYLYYEQILSALGISVEHAETFQQWLDFITQTNHVDVVVTGISVFAGMESRDINKIKSVRAGLPTILTIPGNTSDYLQIIEDSQCVATLVEPTSSNELIKLLKQYIKS